MRRRAGSKADTVNERTRRRQLVSAFGEKMVEAELLRRGWSTANSNMSVKNSADFDIFAQKHSPQTVINVRVKTCGIGVNGFAFGTKPGREVTTTGLSSNDFTVLVVMGEDHPEDTFYIVPTRVVRRALANHRSIYLDTPNRDGTQRIDLGRYDLRLTSQRTNPAGSGFAKKWNKYLNNWTILEMTTDKAKGRRG